VTDIQSNDIGSWAPSPSIPAPQPPIAAPQPPSATTPGVGHEVGVLDFPAQPGIEEGRLGLQPVYLITTDTSGEVAVPGLGLSIDELGVCVIKSDGSLVAVLPWDDIGELSATERTVTPEGDIAVIVEASTPLRTHRFVVPTDNPDGVEAALGELVRSREEPASSRRVSPALLGVLFIVVAAAVVVAVLAAMGALKA